jgi:hypothetical protein
MYKPFHRHFILNNRILTREIPALVVHHFTFRYIDDVLSLNNSRFGDFVDRIYPIELEIKDTTEEPLVQKLPCLQEPYIKEILIGTTSSEISHHLREI